MKFKTATLLLLVLSIVSCGQDDSVEPLDGISLSEDTTPTVELEFTDSPVDLQGLDARFAADIPYDQFNTTQFDVFLPESSSPTGMVIFIHGGGFTGGDKSFIYTSSFTEEITGLLSSNIAIATINYRLLENNDTDGVLKSLNDSRRAIQYIRYIHRELNIDPDKICLFGTSAGASTALWLSASDDFADENGSDPVLRQSTRVLGIGLRATQSSLDIESRWINDVYEEFDVTLDDIIEEFGEESVFRFYGVSSFEEYESPEIDEYRRSVDMLSLLTPDDPEIWVENTGGTNEAPQTQSNYNHHPFHAREIKEYADLAGIPNVTTYGNPVLFSSPGNESVTEFFIRKLNE